ncbi:MAG: Putative oxidoreducatse SCO7286 [uncultured Thermomicrobiales bacterium]|uniref:Oxidoreducatse SCO7286 n=1 Tax=uncultured Thermomicrobiales bacterium TaxID=1645740 RepID=A0A6J4VSU6_9BACT|nr:MAG: Putative oxidoreducatse SCO7286 [uncultured Thermomicrobiales bacterium]
MQYRRLGKTGWQVSAISMGCWGIGGQWGPVAEAEALRTIHAARDLGINLFDTADAYGSGVSEELVGKALPSRRDDVYIATKVGNFGRRQGAALSYASPLHIELCCDASLGRLKIDAIDLYQCHIGDIADPSIFLEAFERLVEKGKIRAYGISTDSLAVAQAFNRDGKCATVQLNYSLLNRKAEGGLLPWCAANDIGTLLRGPIAQGVLAGKFTPDSHFDDIVRVGWNEGAGREQFLKRLDQVEQIRFLERPDRTLAQAALLWTLTNPAVTCAIPGAKDVAQITANAGAGDGSLGEDELERLDGIIARW